MDWKFEVGDELKASSGTPGRKQDDEIKIQSLIRIESGDFYRLKTGELCSREVIEEFYVKAEP